MSKPVKSGNPINGDKIFKASAKNEINATIQETISKMEPSQLWKEDGKVNAAEVASILCRQYYQQLRDYDWRSFRSAVNQLIPKLAKRHGLVVHAQKKNVAHDTRSLSFKVPEGYFNANRDMDGGNTNEISPAKRPFGTCIFCLISSDIIL